MQKDAPSILHTLACLYAETGNTKDAREVLLRAMDDWNLDEPNDDVWYVLGRIAEQYGEREIAIADYRKLEKPKEHARDSYFDLAAGADAAEGDGGGGDGGREVVRSRKRQAVEKQPQVLRLRLAQVCAKLRSG